MLTTLLALAALLSPAHADHGHGYGHSEGRHESCTHGSYAQQPVRPAARAKVTVRNATGRPIELYADGAFVDTLPPGVSDLRVPAGALNLTARVDGRVIDRLSVSLAPHTETAWRVDAPRVGELIVRNPLPIPVTVLGPNGLSYPVAAYGDLALGAMPVGLNTITILRPGGGVLEVRSVDVDPWAPASLRVRPPATGLVRVDNDLHRPLRVFVDGRPQALVAADSLLTLELSPGYHRVDLVDEAGRYSHTVESFGVDVDVYNPARLEVGAPPPVPQRPVQTVSVSVSTHGGRAAR